VQVTEADMFAIFGDNDAMLRVADISVDVHAALESGLFDVFANVKSVKGKKDKKAILGEGVKNKIAEGGKNGEKATKDADVRRAEQIINDAIHALNMSATSVYYLAEDGESYRDCVDLIAADAVLDAEFVEFYGIHASDIITLLDAGALNEAILDVVVQNSKPKQVDYLF
jgi:hypothetical protein